MTEPKPKKKAAKKATAKKVTKKIASAKAPLKKMETSGISDLPTNPETFSNEHVTVTSHLEKDCKATLDVDVNKSVLEEAYFTALKDVGKNISVPGFRKGKVPKEFIQKNYSSYIEEQSEQLYIQKALEHALNLTKLRPLNYRNIKPKIASKSKEKATIKFSFELYPQAPLVDLDKLKLKKIEIEEITQDKVDEVIDVMRSYRAKWERVEERGAIEGDFVELDIDNLEDNTKLVSKKRVQIAKGRLSAWIKKLVIGMKKGESKEGTSEWDSTMPSSEKKDFKPTKCQITVLDILTAELPEIDEAFAKAMGTQSIADLRTQVLLRLNKNAEEMAAHKQREDLDSQLESLVDFDLPTSLVEAETKTKITMREQELKDANFSEQDIKKRQSEIKKEATTSAIKSLKLFFILQRLAQENKIIVSEHELQTHLTQTIQQLNLPQEFQSSPQFKNQILQELRMNCFVEILTDKVKRYLLKKVSYS